MEIIQEIAKEWYLLLSQASMAVSIPMKDVAVWAQLPILSVFLLGFVGAMSPCQLTTNLSVLAYISSRVNAGVWRQTIAYLLARVAIYVSIASTVISVGLQLDQAFVPLLVLARKAIGPLMLVVGVSLIGLIRLRASIAGGWVTLLRSRLPQNGVAGAFSLGLVFSFAFCPSLLWIFFGLMIPLTLVSSGGWVFPGVFAIGTAVPLILLSGILATGREMSAAFSERLMHMQAKVSWIAGAVFIVAGLHDTLVYWFL